jgi:hypothetical protein
MVLDGAPGTFRHVQGDENGRRLRHASTRTGGLKACQMGEDPASGAGPVGAGRHSSYADRSPVAQNPVD